MPSVRDTLRSLAGRVLGRVSQATTDAPEAPARVRAHEPARPDYSEHGGEQGEWAIAWGGSAQEGLKRANPINETSSDLMSRSAWMAECTSMLRDPKLGRAVSLHTTRMLAADIVIEPPKGAGEGTKEVCAYLEEAFGLEGREGRMRRPFSEVMREAISGYNTGVSVGEEVYYVDGGDVWLEDIEPRPIARLSAWERDPAGRVHSVVFRRTEGTEYTLPLDTPQKGCLHIAPSFCGDPEGRDAALLRACHFWVKLKRHAATMVWRGFDQWGSEVPLARVNFAYARERGLTSNDIQAAIERARASVAAFFAGGRGSSLLASDIVDFEKYGGGLDISAGVGIMNLIDEQITTAAGAGQLVMGISSSHGSRSAAEVHGDMGIAASGTMLDHFCGRLRFGPVKRLARFKFGPRAPLPLVEHRGLDVDGIAAHLGTLPHLVAARLLDTEKAREKIHRTLGIRAVEEIRDLAHSDPANVKLPTIGDPGSPGPGRGITDAQVRQAVTVLRAALAPALHYLEAA